MATLKSLVDETTNIKNELVDCHSNLKNNLIEKGVECSDTDKMSSLIDKVSEIQTPNTVTVSDTKIDVITDLSNQYLNTFSFNRMINVVGDIRVFFTLSAVTWNSMGYMNVDLVRNGVVIDSKSFSTHQSVDCVVDFSEVKATDILKFYETSGLLKIGYVYLGYEYI